MADLVKKIKIKKQDGTFTDYIPIGAEAQNVSTSDGDSVQLKLNKKPYYYNSVADMKADTKLKAGDMAITLGYYEANDGGEGQYKITNSTTTSLIYNHTLNNKLEACLVFDTIVNVLQVGCKSDNMNFDNAPLLQKLADDLKNGMTMYFPKGEFYIGSGLIIKKNLQLLGNRQPVVSYRYVGEYSSGISFIPGTENQTMITQGSNNWGLVLENLNFNGNSTTWNDKGLSDETSPYKQYECTITAENVNGLEAVHTCVVKNCTFVCFSGYGLKTSQAMQVYSCKFWGCKYGIYTAKQDAMIRDCYITQGETGIWSDKSSNLLIHDCYIDLMSEYGIRCEGTISGYISGYIDHTGYSGISSQNISGALINMNLYRTGMYQGGKTVEDLKDNEDANQELINFHTACGISCQRLENSNIRINAFPRNIDDSQLSSKETPIIGLYTQHSINNIIISPKIQIIIKWYGAANSHTNFVTENGINVYEKNQIKKSVLWSTGTGPWSNTMATKIGDLFINNSTNKIFMATEINTDTNTTTWKEIKFAD